jgi:hypothetical protein
MRTKLVRIRRWYLCLAALSALLLPSCGWDGHFCILGYTTQPLYDLSIRTVRVPIFKNITLRRELEFKLTEAVIREIEAKTPYKVVQCAENADTELVGTIVNRTKAVTNFNQLAETREAETTLTVELVWRDLRPGHVGEMLSKPKPGGIGEPLPPPAPGVPVAPVVVQSMASFRPEIGESLDTAEKLMVDRMAVQIVSMMEKPW